MTPLASRMGPSTTASALCLGLAVTALAASACKDPIDEPGPLQDFVVSLRLLPLPADELNAIGSFDVEVKRNGAPAATFGLAFDPDSGAVSFVDAPPELEAGGVVEATVFGRRLDGSAAGVGGRALPVDLDAGDGGAVTVPVLVGRLDAMSPLSIDLAEPRFGHTATAVGGGVLVVGGIGGDALDPDALASTVEWIDPVGGAHCSSAPTGSQCPLDNAPPPRIEHVAVDLGAFEAGCPVRGALIAGGADRGGAARSDAWLLVDIDGDGGTFARLPDLPRARAGAGAVVLRGCRVLIAGGRDAVGGLIAAIDVVDLSQGIDGATITEAGALPAAVVEPLVIATGNALDEVIVVGGIGNGGPQRTGVVVSVGAGGVVTCDLADAGCNGAASALLCARTGAAVASLDVRSDLAPALIVGGYDDDSCDGAELFHVGVEPPFAAFVAPAGPAGVERDRGATVTAVAGERAVVVGGAVGDDSLADVELFGFPASPIDAAGVAAGGFSVVGDLATARAFHSATAVAGAVVVVGGRDRATPLSSIEVFVPGFTDGTGDRR